MTCQHIYTKVYTRRVRDLFRKRYWIRCFECDIRLGPWIKPPQIVYYQGAYYLASYQGVSQC